MCVYCSMVTFSYNEGKASMVDVLSAQLSWTQAQTNLINAHLAEQIQAVAQELFDKDRLTTLIFK